MRSEIVKLNVGGIKLQVTLDYVDGRIFINSRYNKNLVEEIKSTFSGYKWHGYDEENPRKLWSILDNEHNAFQLEYLKGGNPYLRYDKPIEITKVPTRAEIRQHQINLFNFTMMRRHCILAAEMGCIQKDMIVSVNVGGATQKMTMHELYNKWKSGWQYRDDIKVRSYSGQHLYLNQLKDVIYSGVKSLVKITLASGKFLVCTPDHEILTDDGFVPAEKLSLNSVVMTNGKWIDKDGYVRVGGLKNIHPRWTTGGVYEHILVMEKKVGRYIGPDEVVHHENGNRSDNRIENLVLLSGQAEHGAVHGLENWKNFGTGDLKAREDQIVSIEPCESDLTFDLVVAEPNRNFVANGFIVHNCGKTLTAIEVMEQSGYHDWWYVAPKNALVSVELELIKWNCKVQPRLFTYEQATKELRTWRGAAPRGLIADEAARVKTATSQRTQAINHIAASIRKEHGYESFVILMTGTPAPKSPIDWWSLCNIARPGYLKEGSPDQLKARLAIIEKTESATGGFFPKIVAWRDNESRCAKCGKAEAEHGDPLWGGTACIYEKSINEVAKLNRRMKGLVEVLFKKDCLDLPEKIYRVVTIAPEKATLRTAALIARSSKRAIDTLIKLRELSDGFQYKEIELTNETCSKCHGQKQVDGEACNFCSGIGMTKTFHREALRVACPKDDALNEELETLDDVGRVVIYAGFTESIDRVVEVCQKAGWKTIRVDGRGCDSELGTSVIDCVRVFQSDADEKIAFIGHPGSAGEGLTLTKSPMIIYYSNDFNGGYRIQSEDRIHRMGMDVNRGATIVDFIHLPSDQLVLSNLQRKRELQSITMGELAEALLLDRVE